MPISDTNNYVLDSVLLTLSRAVSSQSTVEHHGRLAPSSFKALREAAGVAFETYRRTKATTSNNAV